MYFNPNTRYDKTSNTKWRHHHHHHHSLTTYKRGGKPYYHNELCYNFPSTHHWSLMRTTVKANAKQHFIMLFCYLSIKKHCSAYWNPQPSSDNSVWARCSTTSQVTFIYLFVFFVREELFALLVATYTSPGEGSLGSSTACLEARRCTV